MSASVELKNASHIIREAHMEGNIVYGTVEILNTPSGKILQSLFSAPEITTFTFKSFKK